MYFTRKTAYLSVFANLWQYKKPVNNTEFNLFSDYKHNIKCLLAAARQLKVRRTDLKGICISMPGLIDPTRTFLAASDELPNWIEAPIVEDLRDHLKLEKEQRVVLGSQIEADSMAEAVYGNRFRKDFWYVNWGPTIQCCLMTRRAKKLTPMPIDGGRLLILGDDQQQFDLSYCCGIREGVQLNTEQWLYIAKRMVIGLQNLLAFKSVPLIVFGGSVSISQQRLLPMIHDLLSDELAAKSFPGEAPAIVPATFGISSGIVGALALHGV